MGWLVYYLKEVVSARYIVYNIHAHAKAQFKTRRGRVSKESNHRVFYPSINSTPTHVPSLLSTTLYAPYAPYAPNPPSRHATPSLLNIHNLSKPSRFHLLRKRRRVDIRRTSQFPVLRRVFISDGFERFLKFNPISHAQTTKLVFDFKLTSVQKLVSPSRCLPGSLQPGTCMTRSLYRMRT
jgi:hypothetical protein